jgi:hypothetical protein
VAPPSLHYYSSNQASLKFCGVSLREFADWQAKALDDKVGLSDERNLLQMHHMANDNSIAFILKENYAFVNRNVSRRGWLGGSLGCKVI